MEGVAEAMTLTMSTDLDYTLNGSAAILKGDMQPAETINNYYTTDNSQTFNQTNNSPKALSRFDQYRQSQNLLRMARKV